MCFSEETQVSKTSQEVKQACTSRELEALQAVRCVCCIQSKHVRAEN